MKCWYCLSGVDQTTCTLGIRRLKPHAGGRRSMITSLISRLDFRKWAVPAGQLNYYRTNAAVISESVAMLQTLLAGW